MARGRPKVKKELRRVQISISVPPELKLAAEASGNASRFFEEAASLRLALAQPEAQANPGAEPAVGKAQEEVA